MPTDITKTKVYRYDSVADFVREVDAKCAGPFRTCDRDFTGESWGQAVSNAISGRSDRVAQAEALLDKINAQIDTPRTTWAPAMGGAYPVVAEAIMGLPLAMRRREPTTDDRAPLCMYIDLVSSGAIDVTQLHKRGVAYLALAMALANTRAVEVWGVIAIGSASPTVFAFKIGSTPVDLAVACNALCSMGLIRGLGYSYSYSINGRHDGNWCWGLPPDGTHARREYTDRLRQVLGAAPHDLVTPGLYFADETVTDPVKFVQRSINEYTKQQEEV